MTTKRDELGEKREDARLLVVVEARGLRLAVKRQAGAKHLAVLLRALCTAVDEYDKADAACLPTPGRGEQHR